MNYHFDYLLSNLIVDECNLLYDYNQYLLKRFFEYAFDNDDYINKIKGGSTGLHKTTYCARHEKVIITACITALTSKRDDNIELYKQFYSDYLIFKTSYCGWRGRIEWFDFHKTIYSHFIWVADLETFYWSWDKNCDAIKGFKKKYPRVSPWRRKWYLHEMTKLKQYLLRICLVAGKITAVKEFIEKGILTTNTFNMKILRNHGYLISNGEIRKGKFTQSPEWKWMHGEKISIKSVSMEKTIELCKTNNLRKEKIVELFRAKDQKIFWNFFVNIDVADLKFITCTNLKKILAGDKFILSEENVKHSVILKIFEYNKLITKSLLPALNVVVDYKISACEGINILLDIFSKENADDYWYLLPLCKYFINEDISVLNINTFAKSITTNDVYWLYSLIGSCIQPIISSILPNKKINEDTCAICLGELQDKSCNCKMLPCGHCFHEICLKKDYMTRMHSMNAYECSICRAKIHWNSLSISCADCTSLTNQEFPREISQ
tara:strand:+ start:5158 stop:6636 length:1479 start_codon:yes stop_codon:yes gene_type:complete